MGRAKGDRFSSFFGQERGLRDPSLRALKEQIEIINGLSSLERTPVRRLNEVFSFESEIGKTRHDELYEAMRLKLFSFYESEGVEAPGWLLASDNTSDELKALLRQTTTAYLESLPETRSVSISMNDTDKTIARLLKHLPANSENKGLIEAVADYFPRSSLPPESLVEALSHKNDRGLFTSWISAVGQWIIDSSHEESKNESHFMRLQTLLHSEPLKQDDQLEPLRALLLGLKLGMLD